MQKRFSRKIYVLIAMLFSFNSCNSQTNIPDKISGMLLYVEDLDGRDGNMAGNFSDIAAFDVNTKQEYIITNDHFYDNYPTYSKATNRIYFESKRENYSWTAGLSAKSYLYYIDLKEKAIRSFNEEEKDHLGENILKWDLHRPTACPTSNKLIFYTFNYNLDIYSRLILYDNDTHKNEELFHYLLAALRFVWDESETKIVFECQIDMQTKCIATIDINTKETKKIILKTDYKNSLGDYKYDKVLYIEKYWNDETTGKICVFDPNKEETTVVAVFTELGFDDIKDPVFKDENTIFFIGSNYVDEDRSNEDVYEMDLTTKKIKQITFNNKMKDCLHYYE